MRSLGVLFNTFEGTDANFAGGHVHAFEVLARLRGFRIVVFAPGYARQIVARLVPCAEFVAMPSLPADAQKSMYLLLHRAVTSVWRVGRLRACDVVYATSPALPDILPAALAKPGRAVVCIFHVLPPPWKRSGSILRNFVAFLAEAVGLAIASVACRSVIVGSRHAGEALRRRGFRRRMFVTTNGVDHGVARSKGETSTSAIFVGRLHPTKGVSDLLDAWALVLVQIPEARLTIVGDGPKPYREQLRARAERIGIAHAVGFAGRVDDAARSAMLAASSVFVFPSYEEGWGIALAEAMAAGLPCVTYDLPVYREVFPRGLSVAPVGDVRAFAARILALFRDEALRFGMAADATSLSATFSWDRAASVELEALEFAAEDHERRSRVARE